MQAGIVPWSTSALLTVLILTPVRRTEVFIISLVICDYPSTQEQSRVDRPRRLITAITARLHAWMRAGQSFVFASESSMRDAARIPGAPQQCKDNKEEKDKLHKICQDYKANKVTALHSPGANYGRARPVWRRRGSGEASPGADVAGWARSRCRRGWDVTGAQRAMCIYWSRPAGFPAALVINRKWRLNNCSRFRSFRNF